MTPDGQSPTDPAKARTQAPWRGPYQGLSPYAEDDAPFFFGRDGERDIFIANLRSFPLTIVYGASGVGKTSLLRAGVAHQLQASAKSQVGQSSEPELVVVFDAWRDDPIAGIEAAIREAAADLFSPIELGPAADGLLETLRRWTDRLSCDVLIILDQVEEYFLYHAREDGKRTFAVEFPRAVTADDPRIRFMVSIREDALSRLDRFKGRIPGLLSNRLHVQHLDARAARAAIQNPLEEYNRRATDEAIWSIEAELVELVLQELRPGRVVLGVTGQGAVDAATDQGRQDQRVETPFLQLVMTRLWAAEMAAGSHVLRAATLRQLGGARRIVRSHLDQAMEALGPDDQDVAAKIFHYLVTPAGSKVAYTAADLAGYANLPEAQISQLLERLSLGDARIVRPVGPGPDDSRGTRYEVFHDVLAPAVLDWKARHVAAQDAEKRLDEARRRLRRLAGLAAVLGTLLVATIALAIIAVYQGRRADVQREQATSYSMVAQANARSTDQPDLSVLLNMAAYQLLPSDEARSAALLQADRRRDASGLLTGAAGELNGATFSPDGRLLAAGDVVGVRVWELPSRRQVAFLPSTHGRVRSVDFGADGRLLAAADATGVRVWELPSRRQVAFLPSTHGRVRGVAFSPDGQLLAAGDVTGVWFWNLGDRQAPVLARHAGGADSVAFTTDGRMLATASSQSDQAEIALWSVRRHQVRRTLGGHDGGVAAIALSSDGKTLVSAGRADGTILLWNLATGTSDVLTDEQGASTIAISPDGQTMASAGQDVEKIVLWNIARLARVRALIGNIGLVDTIQFSPDGRTLASSASDRAVALFDLPSQLPASHTGFINSLAFSPDSKTLATAGADANVTLWDVPTRTPRAVLQGHEDEVTGVAFSPDGRTLASAAFDGVALLWDVESGKRLAVPSFTARDVFKVAFSPRDPLLALAGNNGTVSLWDTRHWVRAAAMQGHKGRVNSLAFSADGRKLASGGEDGLVLVWDVTSHALLATVPAHSDAINRVAFGSDGHTLASAGDDSVAIVWDLDRLIPVATFPGENVQFSPDGRTLAIQQASSGSAEDRVVLWDVARRVPTGILTYGIGETFSPDGRLLATAGDDVVFHELGTASWQQKLCALAGRDLTAAEWEQFAPGVRKRGVCN